MLTCKDFLKELNEYLDETCDAQLRKDLQQHINECPNCWVVVDTCQKTLKVYKGMEPQEVPSPIKDRLMAAVQKKDCRQVQTHLLTGRGSLEGACHPELQYQCLRGCTIRRSGKLFKSLLERFPR